MNQQELRTFLENEPLVHAPPTLAMMHPSFLEAPRGSIYYGTGLATPKAASVGLPFDVLILVLVAEKFRREFGLDAIHHHLADTHALTNDFCTPEGVAAMTGEYRTVLERIARVTGIPLRVRASSEFDRTSEYESLLAGITTDKGEYVRRELADIRWYHKRHGVRLKLGWLVQATETEMGFDERLYDREFLLRCDHDMSFAYAAAGRTLDPKRIKASPYIAIVNEPRILFKADEDVRAKYDAAVVRFNGDRKLGGVVAHWSAILRLWDRVSKTPSPRRAGNVIDRVADTIRLIMD